MKGFSYNLKLYRTLNPIVAIYLGLALIPFYSSASNYEFDADMLGGDGKHADLSYFNDGGQLPGVYRVTVVLNGSAIEERNVLFHSEHLAKGQASLVPCLKTAWLSGWGVRVEDYPSLRDGGDGCARLSVIPQAKADFQFYSRQLVISIPQVSMRNVDKGIAPQALWDDGMNAILLSYNANASRVESTSGVGGSQRSAWMSLNPGLNIGAWRLRNQTNWSRSSGGESQWQTVSTRAERGLYSLKSRVTLGDSNTPSDIFDSVPFRGVMLASDELMLPSRLRSIAPVIRGIARTQAHIEVKQNGYTIYDATVAPGAFALSDLSPSSNAGDLQVTVRESDGHTQVFVVPWQTPAIALHEGRLKYSAMTGHYRQSGQGSTDIPVGQGTVMYGLPGGVTAYAGLQAARAFMAGAMGLGIVMGDFGALSLDLTQMHAEREQTQKDVLKGSVWRLRYGKMIPELQSSISASYQRFDSQTYTTLSDMLNSQRGGYTGFTSAAVQNLRSRASLSVQQRLGMLGNMYVSLDRTRGFNSHANSDGLNLSYSLPLPAGMSLSLGWSTVRQLMNKRYQTDRIASLWLNVPLGSLTGNSSNLSMRSTSSSKHGSQSEISLQGDAVNNRLNWNLTQIHQHGGDNNGSSGDSTAMHSTWRGDRAEVSGGYSYSHQYHQMDGAVSGEVVLHAHGITFGNSSGNNDTLSLVDVPGGVGVSLVGGESVTDHFGHALQSGLQPYQKNTVDLDPLSFDGELNLDNTQMTVIPTEGAVIAARFESRIGGRAVIRIGVPGGKTAPFGSVAWLEGESELSRLASGVVDSNGEVYLTGLPPSGRLNIKWSGQQCAADYHLPEKAWLHGVYRFGIVCQPTKEIH